MSPVKGRTEFEIFKNFYTVQKKEEVRHFVDRLSLESKNNVLSEQRRELVKQDFDERKYYDCLEKYTECLRLATCNGREYAMALANRSATYFAMNKFKNCLKDINLCLQADYPINLKPKILIRKVKCCIKMGNLQEMVETINDCWKEIQDNPNLPKTDKDNYMKEMKSVMEIKQIDIADLPLEDNFLLLEIIREKNQLNPNVSASIQIRYNKNSETDYVAERDISRGEVLFVDQVYSMGFMDHWKTEETTGFFYCDYCWKEAKNCIPCKICVNILYCSENCRDNSWTDYHQWDCDLIRSKYITGQICLPLRTLIKAACSGAIFQISNDAKNLKPSKEMDSYWRIYSFHVDLANVRAHAKMFGHACEMAGFMVEFLEKKNFFTHLMSTSSWQKDQATLITFFGGLLFKHIIQVYERMITMSVASFVLSLNENQEELELLLMRNMPFCAFCPTISALKYSCESNTSTYFNGRSCIVKACKDIKAGNRIFRSGYNYTPMLPILIRKDVLLNMNINCKCRACEDISYNIDILNTFRCTSCDTFTIDFFNSTVCNNCKCITDVEAMKSVMDCALLCRFTKMNVDDTQFLKNVIKNVNNLKTLVNPNHQYMYDIYEELLLLYSKRDNIYEFKEALKNFKTCAKNRRGRFDEFAYVIDLTILCKACFAYLQHNKSILQKQETMDILASCSDAVNEAKEIAEFTFPPLLRLFVPIEFYILKIRISQLSL